MGSPGASGGAGPSGAVYAGDASVSPGNLTYIDEEESDEEPVEPLHQPSPSRSNSSRPPANTSTTHWDNTGDPQYAGLPRLEPMTGAYQPYQPEELPTQPPQAPYAAAERATLSPMPQGGYRGFAMASPAAESRAPMYLPRSQSMDAYQQPLPDPSAQSQPMASPSSYPAQVAYHVTPPVATPLVDYNYYQSPTHVYPQAPSGALAQSAPVTSHFPRPETQYGASSSSAYDGRHGYDAPTNQGQWQQPYLEPLPPQVMSYDRWATQQPQDQTSLPQRSGGAYDVRIHPTDPRRGSVDNPQNSGYRQS